MRRPLILDEASVVSNSRLYFAGGDAYGGEKEPLFRLERNARISSSMLNPKRLIVGEGAGIFNSTLFARNARHNRQYVSRGLNLELEAGARIEGLGPARMSNHFVHRGWFKKMESRFPRMTIARNARLDLRTARICDRGGRVDNAIDFQWKEQGASLDLAAELFPVFPVYELSGAVRIETVSDFAENVRCLGVPTRLEYAPLFELDSE